MTNKLMKRCCFCKTVPMGDIWAPPNYLGHLVIGCRNEACSKNPTVEIINGDIDDAIDRWNHMLYEFQRFGVGGKALDRDNFPA